MKLKVDSESLAPSCELLQEEIVERITEEGSERLQGTWNRERELIKAFWRRSLEQTWEGESGQHGGRARL